MERRCKRIDMTFDCGKNLLVIAANDGNGNVDKRSFAILDTVQGGIRFGN